MREVEVRYLVRDGARIAYEVFGSGPVDPLVVRGGAQFPIDLMRELSQLAEFMNGLGAWARVIVYDSRGTGAIGSVADQRRRGRPREWSRGHFGSARGC